MCENNVIPSKNTGVSVIIPAYNSELVIERIARQVLSQTYTNLELLIVDDGSTDKTSAIIDRLALEDKRIRIFHQPNGGVSKARNKGIQEAKKKYITFIDSDDEVAPNYLINMISAIELYECDLVISGYKGIPKNSVCLDDKCYDVDNLNDLLLIRNLGITFCKVYVTEILRKYKIEFPQGVKLSEDAVFYYNYIRYAQKVVTISNQDYFYYLPEDDAKYNLSFKDELYVLEAMQNVIIPIIQERSHSAYVVERLQQRLLVVLLRVVVSILSHSRMTRAQLFSLIDWEKLLPMMKMNIFFKVLIRLRLFSIFDLFRSVYQKILNKDLFDLLGVDKE